MAEKLHQEFPDKYTAFMAEANAHTGSNPSIRLTVYEMSMGHKECKSFEDGFNILKSFLHRTDKPNDMEIEL